MVVEVQLGERSSPDERGEGRHVAVIDDLLDLRGPFGLARDVRSGALGSIEAVELGVEPHTVALGVKPQLGVVGQLEFGLGLGVVAQFFSRQPDTQFWALISAERHTQ